MIRESDEECLALIATIRKRGGTPDGGIVAWWREYERLLDNLEARIEEGVHPDCLREKDRLVQENLRLRGQLAELGTEFVKLTGEIERLHTECEEKEIVLSCSSLRAPKDAHFDRTHDQEIEAAHREDAKQAEAAAVAEKVEDAYRLGYETRLKHETRSDRFVMDERKPVEDCPCGTETCREAWRELREAKAEWVIKPEGQEKPASAQVGRDAEQGAIRFRDIIREEVAKATAESSREIAVQLISLAERLAAVELHEAANQPGEPSFRLRTVLRQEVAAEVERQLGEWQEAKASPEIRTWLDNVQHELDKLRVALEAEAS